jgi:hypothetical protein
MIGLRAASLEAEKAKNDLERAAIEYLDLQTDLGAAWTEGQQALARESSTRLPVLDIDFWLDEKIVTFTRRMRAARRAVFLSVVAVEYEFQTSTGKKLDVLAARSPQELKDVLQELRQISQTGQVAGANPNNAVVVLSVADDLMQLGTATTTSGVDRCERLRSRITAADSGYPTPGFVLPFKLAAASVLDSGEVFELFGALSCAERLWSVNASIVPKDGATLVSGADPTGKAQVFLRKRNTFQSQWCDGRNGLQQASFQPGVNLFRDATTPADAASPDINATADGYTMATIDARFGVSRVDLEDEQYFNGDSQELAGRGLYGDYELFFPDQIFAFDPSAVGKLDPNAICDVLLRFDYVSATRN